MEPYNARVRNAQIVMRTKHIRRNRAREVATEFFLVHTGRRDDPINDSVTRQKLYDH